MRSAIFRWMPLPPASITTSRSGNFSRSRWCFIPPPWSTSWDLGALRAPAIPLEGHRAAAARARLEHSGAHHRPHCRRAARPYSFRAPKALSAGALCLLDRLAVQDTADVRGPGDLMGSRLHRPLFLAPDESVL